jgi:hypothetical protein
MRKTAVTSVLDKRKAQCRFETLTDRKRRKRHAAIMFVESASFLETSCPSSAVERKGKCSIIFVTQSTAGAIICAGEKANECPSKAKQVESGEMAILIADLVWRVRCDPLRLLARQDGVLKDKT